MKICKKCKKKVLNNIKICNYCGADLSKTKKTTNLNNEKIDVKEDSSNLDLTKTEFLFTDDFKEQINQVEQEIAKEKKSSKKAKRKSKKERKLEQQEKIKNQLQEKLGNDFTLEGDIPDILFAEKFKLEKKSKTKVIKTKDLKLKLKNIKVKELFKENKNKKKNVKKIKTKKNKSNVTRNKDVKVEEKLTKVQQIKLAKKKLLKRRVLKTGLVIVLVVGFVYLGYRLLSNQLNLGTVITEKDRNKNNVFEIGEVVTYKDISYSVLKVETSMGTKYKKPKEGNHFVVVTISFENNSSDKYKYSSMDWKMINSLEEETGRIITPINAGHALYSGVLVVGASKTASVVFEEPIGDEGLYLRYYDRVEVEEHEKAQEELEAERQAKCLEEEFKDEEFCQEDYEVKEVPIKPVFSVKIKLK